ncbi:hypothetical protein DPEC_G00169280 [Dallia pectoralis]|uniref:Uncharacterized protein n=1 Tax=Dallia pectoralis TaxID=75939 RepID=A0ACC2GD11_DALPE|nr:hypothetical protein DPEC_G00169280 [Dallia pectoralis]
MERDKGLLMDEIEKSLWNLTEDNLRFLCEHHGQNKYGSNLKGMDHRSLRRKILEEMWDNTDSMKSEEQGMSWLLQLKKEIRRILEDGSVKPLSPSQSNKDQGRAEARDADNEWKKEKGVELPSTGFEAGPVSPNQSDAEDDSVDSDTEDSDWLPATGLKAARVNSTQSDNGTTVCDGEMQVRDWMTSNRAEISPEVDTPGQRDKAPRTPPGFLRSPGRASRGSALLRCLNTRVSVANPGVPAQLGDCKTSHPEDGSLSSAKQPKETLPAEGPGSHVCHHCGKSLGSQKSLKSHLRVHTGEKPHNCSQCGETFRLQRSLRKHQKLHSGEVRVTKKANVQQPCPHCKATLTSKKELKEHLRIYHTEKTQLCSECGTDHMCAPFVGGALQLLRP